jgi:hypothetical protein
MPDPAVSQRQAITGAAILTVIVFGSVWLALSNVVAAAVIAVLCSPLIYFTQRWARQRRT